MLIQEIIKSCKKEGNFTLHSGQKPDHIFDILELLSNRDFLVYFSWFTENDHLLGIEFGGALLASIGSQINCNNGEFSIIRKDGTLYGKIPDNYVLIDDVVTTENSIRNAIEKIGKYPSKIKCIVDRRKIKSLHIESMYQ